MKIKDKILSVIVPAYNEKNTIDKLLGLVEEVKIAGIKKEIIIIDDFSTDGTREILDGLKNKYKIIFKDKNGGKGSAIREGFNAATGDFIIIQDADMEYDPNEYINVITPLVNGKADVVYGSRFMGDKPHRVLYFWHYIGNKILTTFSNMLTNLNLTDMETCYKAFSRHALDKIKNKIVSNRFGIEPEITALVAKNKLRIYEVGISYYGRTYEEGKKIGWKDGFSAIWCIIKFNLFK
jgi:glycosyltransferase involved in cell wall biosynthesis